jgi:hypothetical protein
MGSPFVFPYEGAFLQFMGRRSDRSDNLSQMVLRQETF